MLICCRPSQTRAINAHAGANVESAFSAVPKYRSAVSRLASGQRPIRAHPLEVGVVRLGVDGPDVREPGLLGRSNCSARALATCFATSLCSAKIPDSSRSNVSAQIRVWFRAGRARPRCGRGRPRDARCPRARTRRPARARSDRAASALLVAHHGRTRDHQQARGMQPAELRDQLVRHPVAEVILLRVAGPVLEGEDGQLDGRRRAAGQPRPHAADVEATTATSAATSAKRAASPAARRMRCRRASR